MDEEKKPLLRWARRRHFGYRCQSVRRARLGGGRALDVGCGTGLFLSEMVRRGNWYGVGMDINQRALAVARRQGVPGWCGEAGDLCLSTASIDIVTMWDVLEHVLDPRKTLSEIHRILKPDGVLLLSTPNGRSWQARLWGKSWCGWDVPRHLQVFAPQVLHRFLKEMGFEVVRHLSFPMERFYLVESGRRWLRTYHSAWTEPIARWLMPLLGWTIWPVLRLIDRTPSASSIVLEARVVAR
jgi:2-polyprenyl-3-methyl-5-hydroxy-6-metoxy-1,4-benzoquinol methylase